VDAAVDLFMRESDAFSWYMERDPVLRSTIVAVAWLDAVPDWDALRDKLERAGRLIPLFRMRPEEPPARIATPRWVPDPDFDLDWHVRRVDAPAPHDDASVVALARTAATTAFDPARPLWEFTFVEGLADGGAAIVMKLHHSLTDGVGGMQLALLLFDVAQEPEPPGDMPPLPELAAVDGVHLVRESIAHDMGRVLGFARHEATALLPGALDVARHPVRSGRELAETVASIGRLVAPVTETLSPIMTARGLGRHLDLVSADLDDLKRAAAFAGGSVNDGFLAAVTGGLRRYHDEHGAPVDELRVTLPVSIRNADDPIGGNRITLQRFTVPVGEADPARRIEALHERCARVRAERSLAYTNAVAGTLNLLPSSVLQGILRRVDFLASDVPGIPVTVYLGGAQLLTQYAFGPTIGAAVNVTLMSYVDVCTLGINVDTGAIPDPEMFRECLVEGFDEVLAAG